MKKDSTGRKFPLSLARRIVCDLLHFGQKIPTVPVQRRMRLASLREARAGATHRISWPILFTKAYALLARDLPILRQSLLTFPWEHVYEHPVSNPVVAIEREYQGEKIVVGCHLRTPEDATLSDLQERLDRFRARPLESIAFFRKSLLVARLPRFLRRWMWWYALNASGYRRAKYFGTFGVTVYSALGAESLHPISPLTTTLNYGIIEPDGTVPVRIIYDHRLMDGSTIARALADLEEILNGPILRELTTDYPAQDARHWEAPTTESAA
jgi:hypothetical protein